MIVPVLSVHRMSRPPHVFDGVESLHDHLALRHRLRTAGQPDGHDRGQHLGHEPDGECQREEDRITHRPPECKVHEADRGDENQRRTHQHQSEGGDAPFERRGKVLRRDGAADPAELRVGAGSCHEYVALTARHVATEMHHVGSLSEGHP